MRALWKDLQYLTDTYNGGRPLADFLKAYFKLHHRLGSRDRRLLTDAVFAWYRAAKGFDAAFSFEQRAQACMALCATEPRLQPLLPEGWAPVLTRSLPERQAFLAGHGISFRPESLLPAEEPLSGGISAPEWLQSMLRQPRLFARLRQPAGPLLRILADKGIFYETGPGQAVALPIGTPLHELWPQAAYTIQDASSQTTGDFFDAAPGERWWDCCAGGGGKSLLLRDLEPRVRLTVSDVRPQALSALAERFRESGLKPPASQVVDASDAAATAAAFPPAAFDAVLCDVPCSGSGTWARTPEGLHFFDRSALDALVVKQAAILRNAASRLRPGGRAVYITCSVFRRENEGVVEAVLADTPFLTLERKQLINGVAAGADTLFAAVLRAATDAPA